VSAAARLTPALRRAVVLAALACGAGTVALLVASDHQEAKAVWAILGPAVGWSFIGTGIYAWRRRPESRSGELMVLLGFAWFLSALSFSDAPALYTFSYVVGGLWGGVFLHLIMAFPSGRLAPGHDRVLVIAGYLIFTVASIPAMLFASPHDLGCDDCPDNMLMLDHHETLAAVGLGIMTVLYAVLFVLVLVRLTRRWRSTPALERLQLTPVYVCGLGTFLLVTAGNAGAGDPAWWAGYAATALLPFAFLAGLLRSHVAHLDAQLRARLEELRASRARLVEAGDTARRRLERDLHDGAQARLLGVVLLLGHARRRLPGDGEVATTLDRALDELKASLAELRELASGIHPPVLTEKGLEPALESLAARASVPVVLDAHRGERLPRAVETTAYFVVSEALANVVKYAQATEARVAIGRSNGNVTIDVVDDGVGGADEAQGSGLRGLADRLAAVDGTLAVDSPVGGGTRLHAEIPADADVARAAR
jgi:signal transduction histidine kinase